MTKDDKQLLDEMIKGVNARIDSTHEIVMLQLEQILEQTKKTNGRVTKLEQETTFWRWFERKPVRFVAAVIFIIILSIENIREILIRLM